MRVLAVAAEAVEVVEVVVRRFSAVDGGKVVRESWTGRGCVI